MTLAGQMECAVLHLIGYGGNDLVQMLEFDHGRRGIARLRFLAVDPAVNRHEAETERDEQAHTQAVRMAIESWVA